MTFSTITPSNYNKGSAKWCAFNQIETALLHSKPTKFNEHQLNFAEQLVPPLHCSDQKHISK